jgi:mRNA-degrading endonuclease RelE of RelBE toxin-antitoxin system
VAYLSLRKPRTVKEAGERRVVLLETPTFTRQVEHLLDAESYRLLQLALVDDPECGALLRGSGGLRKVRWPGSGRGKRGGVRVIYYWAAARETVLLLLAYAKSEKDDLTREQLKVLRRVVQEEFG